MKTIDIFICYILVWSILASVSPTFVCLIDKSGAPIEGKPDLRKCMLYGILISGLILTGIHLMGKSL